MVVEDEVVAAVVVAVLAVVEVLAAVVLASAVAHAHDHLGPRPPRPPLRAPASA